MSGGTPAPGTAPPALPGAAQGAATDDRAWLEERSLRGAVVLASCAHMVLAGSRVAVTLSALAQGAGAGQVGLLLALYALLPMMVSVWAGRWSDRVGVRTPMLAGCVLLACGAAVPCAVPGVAPLYIAAALIGLAFNVFQVAVQNAVGELGGNVHRARNFSLLGLGQSTSMMVGPLIAGFAIDHLGFDWAFGILALIPLVPAMVLAGGWLPALPGPQPAHDRSALAGAWELLADGGLRRLFAINALYSLGWELQTIVVPLLGNAKGLSASAIGSMIASFAAATFTVRFLMPAVVKRVREADILMATLVVAGLAYGLLPMVTSPLALAAATFAMGLGLGGGQPIVMALLHSRAPRGRMGEATGVRMALVQTMAVTVPLVFGSFGATFGLAPVMWGVGSALAGGGWFARQRI